MAAVVPYIPHILAAVGIGSYLRSERQAAEKTASDAKMKEIERAVIQQENVKKQVEEQEVKTTVSQDLARKKQRQRALSSKAQGRKGTILTTPQAELGQTPVGESAKSGTKTLLGA